MEQENKIWLTDSDLGYVSKYEEISNIRKEHYIEKIKDLHEIMIEIITENDLDYDSEIGYVSSDIYDYSEDNFDTFHYEFEFENYIEYLKKLIKDCGGDFDD